MSDASRQSGHHHGKRGRRGPTVPGVNRLRISVASVLPRPKRLPRPARRRRVALSSKPEMLCKPWLYTGAVQSFFTGYHPWVLFKYQISSFCWLYRHSYSDARVAPVIGIYLSRYVPFDAAQSLFGDNRMNRGPPQYWCSDTCANPRRSQSRGSTWPAIEGDPNDGRAISCAGNRQGIVRTGTSAFCPPIYTTDHPTAKT